MNRIRTIFGVLNFLLIKLVYWNRLTSNSLSVISCKSQFNIKTQGRINLNGKMSLSDYGEILVLGKLTLGKNVFINKFSRIVAHANIEIGNNVLIAQHVSILDHDHRHFYKNDEIHFEGYNIADIIIGNNVLICDKVTILKGTVIGDNVIIGANCLVKGNIPANSKLRAALPSVDIISMNKNK